MNKKKKPKGETVWLGVDRMNRPSLGDWTLVGSVIYAGATPTEEEVIERWNAETKKSN